MCGPGALRVSERAGAGLGGILVPYPLAGDDHQPANAAYLADPGGAEILPQSQLNAARLGAILTRLLGDRARLLAMAEAARARAMPDAARRIAAACLAEIAP